MAYSDIIKIAKNGGVLKRENSCFDCLDKNYIDIRGIDFGLLHIKNLIVENANLSFCTFNSSRIEKSVFRNVIFEETDFSGILDKGNLFLNVSFIKCKFNVAAVGHMGSKYINCHFEKTSYIKTAFIRPEFTTCNFINCKFNNSDFDASSFEKCKFKGQLNGIWFRGSYGNVDDLIKYGEAKKNKMESVSFEDSTLVGVQFSNDCDLSTIKLPKTGRYQIIKNWYNKLKKLEMAIRDWPSDQKKAAELFIHRYLVHAKDQDTYLLNIDEIESNLGPILTSKIIYNLTDSLN